MGTPSRSSVRGMLYGIEDGWEHTGLILGANARTLDLWTINGDWGNRVATQSWTHVGGRRWKYGSHEHAVLRELVAEHRP